MGPSLDNILSNSFKRSFTWGGKTQVSRRVTVHVSVPLQMIRLEGCSTRSIFSKVFSNFSSCWMTLWEGTLFSHAFGSLRAFCFSNFIYFFSSSLFCFICTWSFTTCECDKGLIINFFWLWVKVISLVRPLFMVFLSNCQGLPNKMWQASMETTSHKMLSL